MEINIKCEEQYCIELTLHALEFYKLDKLLGKTNCPILEAKSAEGNCYILKLNVTQLTYILNYLLGKEEQ